MLQAIKIQKLWVKCKMHFIMYFQERLGNTQVPETNKELKIQVINLWADAEAAYDGVGVSPVNLAFRSLRLECPQEDSIRAFHRLSQTQELEDTLIKLKPMKNYTLWKRMTRKTSTPWHKEIRKLVYFCLASVWRNINVSVDYSQPWAYASHAFWV